MSKHNVGWQRPASTSAARRERRKAAEQQRRQAEAARQPALASKNSCADARRAAEVLRFFSLTASRIPSTVQSARL